jgi:hypothetical protein
MTTINKRKLLNEAGIPVCGAKRQNKDDICMSQFVMENGRCRIHGGSVPRGVTHPSYIHGKSSKVAYLPDRLIKRAESLTGDVLDNIEESISIQKALESDLLERLKTGESGTAWLRLRDTVNALKHAYSANVDLTPILAQLQRLAKSGVGYDAVRHEIQSIHETQRKLTETLTKSRKEVQETYTQTQWNEMLQIILLSLKKHIADHALLGQITREWSALQDAGRDKLQMKA